MFQNLALSIPHSIQLGKMQAPLRIHIFFILLYLTEHYYSTVINSDSLLVENSVFYELLTNKVSGSDFVLSLETK